MADNLTDAEKLKKQKLIMSISIVVVAISAFVVGRITGYTKGYDKGYYKGGGWK